MCMAMLTSIEIVCVSGLSPWIHHGPVRSGWDGLASGGHVCCGGNRVRHTNVVECMSICGSHTNQPGIIEPYIGSGTIMQLLWGIVFMLFFSLPL